MNAIRALLGCIALMVSSGLATAQSVRDIPGSALTIGQQPISNETLISALMQGADAASSTRGGPWHGYAAHPHYLVLGGKQPTLPEVARDLRQATTTLFKSAFARTQFVRAMAMLRPDINDAVSLAAVLENPNQSRITPCVGTVTMIAYNGQGSLKRHPRACVAGENLVELLIGGRWVAAFSLGCLNPIDAPIARIVTDPCPVRWEVPTRSSPADGRSVIVFVPAEAIKCLPPTAVCDVDCEDWMRGLRGRPSDPRIAAALRQMIQTGGGAYRLPAEATEVRLPADVSAVWCDKRIHHSQEAYFMGL